MIKNVIILIGVFVAVLTVSVMFLFNMPYFSTRENMEWEQRKQEIESRLLSVPIILYHNIDGKGVFSIDNKTLRNHFNITRDLGIRIIPLKVLMEKLESHGTFGEKVMVITFDDGFNAMYSKLLPLVREFGYPVTLFVYIDNIVIKGKKSLDWNRLREMDSSGISIESHTLSHTDLTILSKMMDQDSQKKLFDEIYLSKRVLELYLNREITMFAFPYGRYDLNLIHLCALAGYSRVFSTDYGSNVVTRDNFCLRRQHIKKNYSLEHIISLIE